MAAPIVYRWDDTSAPVCRGERASLVDILTACLVNGYGSKAAAGWTRPHVDGNGEKATFLGGAGTGFYLQVDMAATGATNIAALQGFETMSDIDTGVNPFNVSTQPFYTSSATGTTARPWVLVADDRAFYLVVWNSITATPGDTSYITQVMFFGDLISRYATDAYCCGLISSGNSSRGCLGMGTTAATTSGTLGSQSIAMPRLASGASGSLTALAGIYGGGPGPVTSNLGLTGLEYTAGDQVIIAKPIVGEGAAFTFRGWLPGFYYPCHPLAFGQLATVVVGTAPNELSFLSIRTNITTSATLYTNYFISLDDWRA